MLHSFANSKGKDITVEVVDVLGVKQHGGDYFFIISDGFERSLAWLRNEFLDQSEFQHMVGDNQIHSAIIQYRDFMDLPPEDTRFTDTIREMTGRNNMLNLACIVYCGYGYRHPSNCNTKILTIPDLSPDIDLVSQLITPEYLENPLNQETTPLGQPKELLENVLPSDLHSGSSFQELDRNQPHNMDDSSLPDGYNHPWVEDTGFDLSPGSWDNDNDGVGTQMNNRYISETPSSQDPPVAQPERTHLERVSTEAQQEDVQRERQSPESQEIHDAPLQGSPEPQELKQSQELQEPQEPQAQPTHTPPASTQQVLNSPCFISSSAPERPVDTREIEETAIIEDILEPESAPNTQPEQNMELIDLSMLSDSDKENNVPPPPSAQPQVPAPERPTELERPQEPREPQEPQEPQQPGRLAEPEISAEPREQTSAEKLGQPQHVSTQSSQTNLTPENQLQTNQAFEAVFRSPITQASSSQKQSDQQPSFQIAEEVPAERTNPRPQNTEEQPEPHRSDPQEAGSASQEAIEPPQEAPNPPQEAVIPPPRDTVNPPQVAINLPQEIVNPPQEIFNPPQETADLPQQAVSPPQETLSHPQEVVNPQPEAANHQSETGNPQPAAEDPSAMEVDTDKTSEIQHAPVENLQNQPHPAQDVSEQPLSSNEAVSAHQRPPKRGYISMQSEEVDVGRNPTGRINSRTTNRNGNGIVFNEPSPAQPVDSAAPSSQVPPSMIPMQSPPVRQNIPSNYPQVSATPSREYNPPHEVSATNQYPGFKYSPMGSFPISNNPNNLNGYTNQPRGAHPFLVPAPDNPNLHYPPNVGNAVNVPGNGSYRPVPVQNRFAIGFTHPPNVIAPQLNPNLLAHQQQLANMNFQQRYQASNAPPIRFNPHPPMQAPMNVAPPPNFMPPGAIAQQLTQRPADSSFPNPSAWNLHIALTNNSTSKGQRPVVPPQNQPPQQTQQESPPNQPLHTFRELDRQSEDMNGAKEDLKLLSGQSAAQQKATAPVVPTPPVPVPREPATSEPAPAPTPAPAPPIKSEAPSAPVPEPESEPITVEPAPPARSEPPEVPTPQPGVPSMAPRMASRVPSFESPPAALQTVPDEAPVAPSVAPAAPPPAAPPAAPLPNTTEVSTSQPSDPKTIDPNESSWIFQANNLTLNSQLNARSDMNHDISAPAKLSQSIFEPPKPIRPPRKTRTKEELEELFSKPLKKKRPPQFRRIKFKFPDVT